MKKIGRLGQGRAAGMRSRTCVLCQAPFECSRNYKGQKFACWNCRMSSEALERGFCCPITNTIMFSPTLASDGHCYERHAIQVWIASAVDNGKQPLSPSTGLPLENLILRPDSSTLKKIEDFVVKNRLQNHPDRVQPPSASEIDSRQRNISAQATEWLTEATGKGGGSDATDMAEYAALSEKRRREEIAAGADLLLAVRSARSLTDLLKQLDCVGKNDTLSTAIGNVVPYLTPNAIQDCFYICRERNRIVHESSAGDELRDVQQFRSAVRRAMEEVKIQVDIQISYNSSTSTPTSQAVTQAPSSTAPLATLANRRIVRARRPPQSLPSGAAPLPPLHEHMKLFKQGMSLFFREEYGDAIKELQQFSQVVDSKTYPDRKATALRTMALARTRPDKLRQADEAFGDENATRKQEAFGLYRDLVAGEGGGVMFDENCYALVMYRLGMCCTPKTGIPLFSKALRKEPSNCLALQGRARAYMKLEDFKSAKTDFESIIDLDTNFAVFSGIVEELEICKAKTNPLSKRGHLNKNEVDELMAKFGLE